LTTFGITETSCGLPNENTRLGVPLGPREHVVCADEKTGRGGLKGLVHRSGLQAQVLTEGVVGVGDAIVIA
jgi:hypothetical protein